VHERMHRSGSCGPRCALIQTLRVTVVTQSSILESPWCKGGSCSATQSALAAALKALGGVCTGAGSTIGGGDLPAPAAAAGGERLGKLAAKCAELEDCRGALALSSRLLPNPLLTVMYVLVLTAPTAAVFCQSGWCSIYHWAEPAVQSATAVAVQDTYCFHGATSHRAR
jgi:hypothetical protein